MMTLKIALRNIFRHKARSVITLSTIVFGCVALIFIGGYFQDIFWKMREGFIESLSGHIQIYRRGFNEHGRIEAYRYLIDNYQEIKELVSDFPEVEYVSARLQFQGLMSTGSNTISFIGQGIEPQNERQATIEETQDLRQFMKSKNLGLPVTVFGTSLVGDDDYQVVLGRGLAETMRAQVDHRVTLLTSTVHGATNALDLNVKGAFRTTQKDFDDISLRLPLQTAQSLLDTQAVQVLVVKLHQTEDTDKVFKSLQVIIRDKKLNLELRRWEDMADFYNKTAELFNMFYLVMRIVIGIVVVLGIFNTMNMSVMERISEIGTIMALGIRRRGVMKLFLFEGLLLGCIGGAIGVLMGIIIVSLVAAIGIVMPPPPGTTFSWLSTPVIVPSIVISTFFLSVFVGGVSALVPAYKASRLEITEALRYR
ncbi:MAG: ABC transporter permease [Candidatus Omnitrophica bacterium]|nr:ABC transporter permease [Candidatus Omnitrophota bacterium]